MRRSNEQPTALQQNFTMTERFIDDTSSSRSLSLKSHESTCQTTTLLDKIGLLNAMILMLGSLCILGDLGFLWLVVCNTYFLHFLFTFLLRKIPVYAAVNCQYYV